MFPWSFSFREDVSSRGAKLRRRANSGNLSARQYNMQKAANFFSTATGAFRRFSPAAGAVLVRNARVNVGMGA